MLIFDIHSISSAITNSSTTLFVLDTEKTLSQVKEIVQGVVKVWESNNDRKASQYQLYKMKGKDIKNHEVWTWYMRKWSTDTHKPTEEIFESYERRILDDKEYVIFIEEGDNVMPYGLMEFVGSMFNGLHIHLG